MNQTADVLIAGAGIIGGSIAWRLAQHSLRVVLLEAGRMGGEASWAGAGMLAPGGEVVDQSSWAELALESLSLYPQFVAELENESGCHIDFQRNGAVELAFGHDELGQIVWRAAEQREIGIASERLDRAALRKLAPLVNEEAAGGLFYPGDAVVDPRDVMQALGAACRARGVTIVEGERVAAIHATSRGVTAGSWEARAAVVAAGAWSSEIAVMYEGAAEALPRAFPVRGHLLGYRMPAGLCRPILRHGHTYLLQRASGFLIAGSSVEHVGFDRAVNPEVVEDIAARAEWVMPGLGTAEAPEAWLGFRPGVEGMEPIVRRWRTTPVWLAYGHYRNGILLAPVTAKLLAAEITSSA